MSTRAITFEVAGPPVPWSRARSAGSRRFSAPEMERAKAAIGWAARQSRVRMIDGPVSVTVCAVFAMPRSCSAAERDKLRGAPVIKRPDADNLMKLVMDALEGIAFTDDRMVAHQASLKIWGDASRTIIKVSPWHAPICADALGLLEPEGAMA